ncbi:unnamed protein product [Adineta ricciae]|uniref:Major facilitator superfamily (MFS) profile domain-containing protein n=1 Tax=Adineta ricciae TaxID=249248 RepID=A0A815BME6_ADIRI|nr:unnamed protein product [Adineta ricciae]
MVRRKTSDSDGQQNTVSDRMSFVFEETTFRWSEWDQQIILGSYWAGYLLTLVPSGWLSISLGAKLMSATAVFFSSSATIALTSIYYFENASFPLVVSLRILIGAAHGILFPVTYTLWSQWAVPNERGTLASIGFSGTNIGTSLVVLAGGLFCHYIDSGWIYIFLLSGILGFIWLPLWLWQVSDAPENHRSISNAERQYIVGIIGENSQRRSVSLSALPWKTIVRSKPIIALFLTETCQLVALFFFLSNLGKILREIQQIPSQYTGYILASGFVFMLVGNISAGKLFFIQFFSTIYQNIGFSYGSGYIVNYADVVPAYAGLIFGIVTAISSFGAVIANLIAGIVIKQPILEDWRKLYILFGIIYLIGGLAFLLWASATPERWATLGSQQENKTIEETVPMNESEQNDNRTRTDEHLYINA